MFRSLIMLAFFTSTCVKVVFSSDDSSGRSLFSGHALYVKFPSKEVVKQSFCNAGMVEFMTATGIENIVDDRLTPMDVVDRVYNILGQYFRKIHGNDERFIAMMLRDPRKFIILEILLQDDPRALDQLQVCSAYKPHNMR